MLRDTFSVFEKGSRKNRGKLLKKSGIFILIDRKRRRGANIRRALRRLDMEDFHDSRPYLRRRLRSAARRAADGQQGSFQNRWWRVLPP